MGPVAAAFTSTARPTATARHVERRSATVDNGRRVVGGRARLGARHAPDDVAHGPHVVVEVRPRANHRRALVADLLQPLRRHRLQRASNDRESVEQIGEVVGAEREEAAVRRRPDAGHSTPPRQQADL